MLIKIVSLIKDLICFSHMIHMTILPHHFDCILNLFIKHQVHMKCMVSVKLYVRNT